MLKLRSPIIGSEWLEYDHLKAALSSFDKCYSIFLKVSVDI